MIKFFRQIRQQLLTENKVNKYLLYAIGEIVLVVIGILIALQINNWNEHQKAIAIEEELLTSLQKEISNNIEQFKYFKNENDLRSNDGSNIIQKLARGIDTLSSSELTRAFNYFPSTIQSPILEGLVNSNSNMLVKNKRLLIEFRLLKNAYDKIIKQEFYLDELWNSKVIDFFVSCGFAFEENLDKETKICMKDIELGGYSKKQFIALIKIKKDLQEYWDNRRNIALEKSKDVLKILQNNAD